MPVRFDQQIGATITVRVGDWATFTRASASGFEQVSRDSAFITMRRRVPDAWTATPGYIRY